MTYPTIQRYPPAGGSPVGADTQSRGALANNGSQLFSMCIGTASDSGFRSYTITTSAEVTASTVTTVYGAGGDAEAPYCITPTDQIFVRGKGWLNGSAELALLDPSTFALIDAWNDTNAGGASPSLPNAPGAPQTFGPTSKQGVSYVACPPAFALGAEPVVIMQAGPASPQFAGHAFAFDEAQALSCGSPAEVGKMFTLGRGGNSATTASFGFYVTTVGNGAANYNVALWPGTPNAAISTTKVATIPIASIDPAWTTSLGCTQPGYDKSDGNVLAFFQTNDAVPAATTVRLVKINSTTGAVMWSTAVAALGMNEIYYAMGASDIDGGTFKYFCPGDQKLYIFNTATGAIISSTLIGTLLDINNLNSIDSYTDNSVIWYGQWTGGSTPPFPVNGITGTTSNYWYRFQVGDAPTPPTPSQTTSSYAYFIERMDNRIWPTIEDAWCLDAALSYPQPTPAGTLTISSATGGRNIGSCNIINGGSGYTAPVAQIVDLAGPGTGAVISLTVTGGTIVAAVPSATGAGYVQPQLTVLDATGQGAVVQPIVTNYVTLSSTTASFSASNVGDIVRAGGGKIEIVTYGTTASTTTTVTGNIITPITATIPNDPLATPIPVTSGSWTMTTPTTSVRGLAHLEGLTVYALADGGVVRDLTVSNGAITLPVSASQILVGLQYAAQLQTMYMEAGGGQTLQTRRKDITQAVIRVDNSASPEVGVNQPDAAAQPNGANVPWTNMVFVPTRTPAVPAGQAVPLFSGDLPITNVFTTWDAKGQIAVQQRDPVPLTVTAIIPWVAVGDSPSGS